MARIKVDLGRVVPGALLVLSGLVLLAVLVLIAIVSFFFSFIPAGSGVLQVALEAMLVPVVLIAAGVITIITGVSWWGIGGEGWFTGIGWARAREDRLKLSARVGELIGVVISFLVFLFLYENQLRGAPFFTSNFGTEAQFFFYGPLFAGMALSTGRAAYGHRNGIRPFDALNALFLAVAAFWLLSAFPFDFTHFADMFPNSFQFIFRWLTNDVGRFLLFLAGILSLLNLAYNAVIYPVVRGRLREERRLSSERPAS